MNQTGSENEIHKRNTPPFSADQDRSRISEILLAVSDGEICGEILEIIDNLKRSEERYRQIVETQTDLVCRFRVGGIVTFVNPAACRLTGLEAKDLIGLNINDFFAEDHRDRAQSLTADINPEDPDRTIETKIVIAGRDFWLQSSVHGFFNSSGDLIEFQVVARDITERKEAERILQERTRDLEAANKELETFSYSVSHDLRAPLRAIEGYSRILADKGRALDEDTRRLISTIRDNTRKMDRLIYDLLGFSRSGRVPLSSVNIQMGTLVKEIWQEQVSANPDRRMELKVEQLPGAFGDRSLIRQAVSNLLSNAVKFSKNSTPALIEIGGKTEGAENIYFVRDNGAGFDMKYCDKLFGVFQRLHPECEYEGTGVGLAIVQRIIYRHGGRVWAEGEIRKGATFYFSLPIQNKY